MIGSILLWLFVVSMLAGFFVAWPLAIVYRFLAGQSHPSSPCDEAQWTLGDVVLEICHRLWTGRFLPWMPRRRVPWNFIDLVVVILLACLLLLGVGGLLQEVRGAAINGQDPIVKQYLAVAADVVWKVSVMAVAVLYLWIRAGTGWSDFGLSWRDLGWHVLVGGAAFAMIAPPVYALQAAIVWLGKWKYEHPLIEMLQESPDGWLYVLLAVSACVLAPLSEEWFFRGLVQGWLERALGRITSHKQFHPIGPANEEIATAASGDPTAIAPVVGPSAVPASELNPYAAPAAEFPQDIQPSSMPHDEVVPEAQFPRSMLAQGLPIIISAVLFGLAHWGHGPAPIPLTVLAVGLGYVYQRTHSIVPVMVVHALFNSLSMLVFYVYMFELKIPLP